MLEITSDLFYAFTILCVLVVSLESPQPMRRFVVAYKEEKYHEEWSVVLWILFFSILNLQVYVHKLFFHF